MTSKILNVYCDQCPIPNGENLCLDKDRVPGIKRNALEDDFSVFHCRETLVAQKPMMCYGVARFLKDNNRPNILMRLEKWGES